VLISVTMDANPKLPVVTTPTVTFPRTTVHGHQSTTPSSSHASPTQSTEVATAPKMSGICEYTSY